VNPAHGTNCTNVIQQPLVARVRRPHGMRPSGAPYPGSSAILAHNSRREPRVHYSCLPFRRSWALCLRARSATLRPRPRLEDERELGAIWVHSFHACPLDELNRRRSSRTAKVRRVGPLIYPFPRRGRCISRRRAGSAWRARRSGPVALPHRSAPAPRRYGLGSRTAAATYPRRKTG
jgi:hypothetical protein